MARNKHPEETVGQILDVASRLFLEKGYEHTSIQDIINNLGGLSKGAIYHHFKSKEEILIAPAMAIERGHNIVDEYGHSALCAVFFMVRPMAVPDDIQQKGSKLNGFVESHCHRGPQESLFAYNVRIRQFAAQQWAKMSKSKSFGFG